MTLTCHQNSMKHIKGKSKCCNADVMNWLGNVTAVMFGDKMPKPTLLCMKCYKETIKNK